MYVANYGISMQPGFICQSAPIVQLSYPAIPLISFYNMPLDCFEDKRYIVAVWRVKKMKTKPVIEMPPFIIEFN